MKKIISIATALSVAVMIVGPGAAQALTADELQVQINALLAQLSGLQTQLSQLQGGTPTGTPAACSGITFTRNLSVGTSGNDVKCLQAFLNQDADTQVAASGAGSPGSETTYFGPLTKAAVIKFQEKYASEILTPIGLTAGTGLVGPMTRTKLNAMLAGTVVPPGVVCGNGTCEAGETSINCPADCPVIPTGAGLNVALASNTPISSTVVTTQGLAPLAKFTFVNGDSSEVKVTTLKLKRIGVSADASLSNVYLLDGAVRLTDAASVSSGIITFNDSTGVFKVAAGASKTITVAADLAAASGETLSVAVNAATDVTSNASAITGTFPMSGNLMTVGTATLAGVQFSATTPTANTDLTPQNDYVIWQNSVVITTRAVNLTRISFREIGTINTTDLQNFRLSVDGVQAGSAVQNLDSSGYVTFDLSAAPVKMEAGTRVVKLTADIIGGSNRNFYFSIRVAADANFIDTQYGVNVAPKTVTTPTTFTLLDVTAGTQTVSSGTLTIAKTSDSPSGNIVNSATNATLGKFTLTAAGEKVKIESLIVQIVANQSVVTTGDDTISTTSFTLRNGMLLANGVQIGSTTNITDQSAGTTFNLGSSLIVEPGSPVTLEVRADIYDNAGTYNDIDATDTLKARLRPGTSNAQGMVSLVSISTPSANTDGNTLTAKAGALTLSKYTAYTAQTAVAPLTAYKLGHFTLTADTTEAVNIDTITVALDSVSSYTTSLYVKYGANTSATKPTAAASNSWSINYQLPAGQTIDVMVYGDVSSSMNAGSGQSTVTMSGTTVGSASAVTSAATGGQVITFSTGAFTSATDGGTPLAQIIAGGQQVNTAKFKFTSANDSYSIKELRFKLANSVNSAAAASSAIVNGILKDGSTVLATMPYDSTNAYFNFTGLSVSVPANTNKVLTLVWDLSTGISSDVTNSQENVKATLDYIKYADSQGAETPDDTPGAGNTEPGGSNLYVFKSIPILSKASVTKSTLHAGDVVNLYSWKMKADAKGEIAVRQMKFTLSWADGDLAAVPELESFKLLRGSEDISANVTIKDEDGNDLTTATGATSTSSTVIVKFTTEESIGANDENTYTLRCTAQGFQARANVTSDDSVSIYMASDDTVNGAGVKYILDASSITQLVTSAGGSAANANFIWSDASAVAHTSDQQGGTAPTGDWSNGYLVKSLSLDSETWMGP